MSIEFLHRCQILRMQISDSPDELGGFCCFFVVFLWMGAKLLLMCFFCFPGEHLNFHVNVTRQSEILRDDSWRFTSWSLHQFRCFLVWWSMSLSVEKNPLQGALGFVDWSCLARVSSISWCFIDAVCNLHFMSRSSIGEPTRRTFTVSAFLPMMRPTVDILSRWICACVLYFPYSDCGE